MEEGDKRLGLIAQDAKAYLPDKFNNIIGSNIITDEQGENSKEIMTMDCARMVCVLWKIVRNQNERIKALGSKLKSKKGIININLFLIIKTLEITIGVESKRLVCGKSGDL